MTTRNLKAAIYCRVSSNAQIRTVPLSMPFKALQDFKNGEYDMARPERFELPTNWFEASYSIQLSYGRFTLLGGGIITC